ATNGDLVDAQVSGVTVGGTSYAPTTTSPTGNRQISTPMTYSSSTTVQASTAYVSKSMTDKEIIGVQVVMSASGAPVNLTSLSFNTSGSTAVSDLSKARVYYTGTSSTFATSGSGVSQFGTDVTSPSGAFN